MTSIWQLFPVMALDLKKKRKLRWFWRNTTASYVATSVGGFDSLDECTRNAMDHGMPSNAACVLARRPPA